MESAPDGSARPASTGLFGSFLKLLNSLGTLWTFALVLLICVDVLFRSFLNKPIAGVSDIASASMVAIIYLQIAAGINNRRLTRADVLIDVIGSYSQRARSILEAVFDCVGIAVFALISWAAFGHLRMSHDEGDYFGIDGVFTLIRWPFWSILVLGCVVSALTFLISAIGHLRDAIGTNANALGQEDAS
jgi:TRAP-type C4-dicarboxylate transport system permease small subunit